MARYRAVTTVEELLARARATLPHCPSPTEALHAQASGALLIDVRGEDQRRDGGLTPGAIVLSRNYLEWRCDPASQKGTPPSPAGTCTSSWSATRDTSPARPRRPCTSSA